MGSEITINSNVASLQTQRRLGQSTTALNRVFERLSSGQRINRAADDAAGLSISESLKSDRRVYAQGVRNLNDGVSLLNIGEGALSELTGIVTRVRELAEQAANGTLGFRQRQSLDKEAQQLSKEYTRIAQTAEFNGIKIFDGSISSLRLQAGYGATGGVDASIGGAKGDGGLAASLGFTLATDSYDSKLGDLNNDGILDLVAAGSTGGITVAMGLGDGTFQTSVSYTPGATISTAVALADVNGDGILDAANAGINGGTGFVNLRLGNGNGTFRSAVSYAAEELPDGVAFGDMNGDGVTDLVTAGYGGGTGRASVRLGTGNGTFAAARSYSMNSGSTSGLALGDMNGDGIVDIATSGYIGGIGTVSVRLGTGGGGLGAVTHYNAEGDYSNAVTVGDLNDDGVLDLVSVGYDGATGRATIRLGNGNGTFGASLSYVTDGSTHSVALGDMDSDGLLDIVTGGGGGGGRATVLLGSGNGSFKAATSYLTDTSITMGIALGDLNADGVLDISTVGGGGVASATVRLGTFSSGVNVLLPFSLQYRDSALQAMADLDRSLKRISAHRGYLGAFQSRVDSAINNVQITIENFAAAESQIRDSDIAQEAANLAKGQILQQAGAAVLAQANQAPQIALLLLGR